MVGHDYTRLMKTLVVDDDINLASSVKSNLGAFAHTVEVAHDGADGSFLARTYNYDVIILDYSLPKKDGITVCREIRAIGKNTPIIFLSNTMDTDTKIEAFRAGADDYITKPFSINELKTRIDAISRRAPDIKSEIMQNGQLKLNLGTFEVTHGDTLIPLTKKEFNLLEYLLRHAGSVVTRPEIMEHVWDSDINPFSNTLEAHIRNLRNKLAKAGLTQYVINVPGRGYMIRKISQ